MSTRDSSNVHLLGYSFIVASLYLFGHAAYDEHRGVAAPPYTPGGHAVEYRDRHPADFRHLMNYEWTCPAFVFLAGALIVKLFKSANRSDPFSPDFAGNSAFDECERQLDEDPRNIRKPPRD
jgi:hypothetical protein